MLRSRWEIVAPAGAVQSTSVVIRGTKSDHQPWNKKRKDVGVGVSSVKTARLRLHGIASEVN